MSLAAGQILHNRYRIEKLLGQGGMGAVYRARDINLDIPVAIKENLDASTNAQKQFEREARILARLSHPHLPRVTDHFFISGQGQYLVMDYVEGEDLGAMLQRLGALPEPQVLTWIMQICDALAYLHSQPAPIIHRDIKPNNIKIRTDGKAMLVDFGIAKVYDPQLATTMGAKAVTPGYSPPEQYGMGHTDARSDVYALGATLYHLLTGQVPPESVQRLVGQGQMPPPRQMNQQISPLVEQVILRAIEVTTERRFQTVEELRTALTQPMGKDTHRPEQPKETPRAKLSRFMLPAGVALVVVILIAASALSGIWNGSRATSTLSESTSTLESAPTENSVIVPTATAIEEPMPTVTPATSTPIPTWTPRPTPTPISPGTVLLQEDFEDMEAQGFSDFGRWHFVKDENNNVVTEVDNSNGSNYIQTTFGSLSWRNYAVEYQVRMIEFSGKAPNVTLDFRKNNNTYYFQSFLTYWQHAIIGISVKNSEWQRFDTQQVNITPNTWYAIRVEAQGARLRVFVDEKLITEVTNSQIETGSLGLSVGPNTYAQFDNIRVIALGD